MNTFSQKFFSQNTVGIQEIFHILEGQKKSYSEEKILRAYEVAECAHRDQARGTGEPFITHPLTVAKYLAEWGADEDTVIAALLHDTVEDSSLSPEEIKKEFGADVEQLVMGLTKISGETLRKEGLDQKKETLRRWFEVMQDDVRVALIKLFDRLHNMETIEGHRDPQKRKQIAEETLDIYTRIANKLSMNELRDRLREISLPYAVPQQYSALRRLRQQKIKESESVQILVKKQVLACDELGKIQSLDFQPISIFGMYEQGFFGKKMLRGIFPYTFVLRVRTVADCYALLGIIHTLWKAKDNTFVDYISTPASNGYQALHTTVLLTGGTCISFKIRTEEMNRYRNRGITLFCFSSREAEKNFPWIENLAYVTNMDRDHSDRFFEQLQQDVLGKSILVYTSQDDPLLLPANSTVLDAAFLLHKKKAWLLKKAFVNGEEAPFFQKLSKNETVFFTFQKQKSVSEEWFSCARTAISFSYIQKGILGSK